MKVLGLASVALLVCTAAFAQQPPVPADPGAADPSVYDFGDKDKTCFAWTDDCRSCQREADSTVNCSNVGIACQPAAVRCTARQAPAKRGESSSPRSPK